VADRVAAAVDVAPIEVSARVAAFGAGFVENARSVSLYPYNWSQILQYVKHTK